MFDYYDHHKPTSNANTYADNPPPSVCEDEEYPVDEQLPQSGFHYSSIINSAHLLFTFNFSLVYRLVDLSTCIFLSLKASLRFVELLIVFGRKKEKVYVYEFPGIFFKVCVIAVLVMLEVG